MYYVYLIKSQQNNTIYVGQTDDLKRRLTEHNAGKNLSTKLKTPFHLVYYEAYASKKDATQREYKLKHHGSSIGHLKRRITNSLIK